MKLRIYITVLFIAIFQYTNAQSEKTNNSDKNMVAASEDNISSRELKKDRENAILSEKEWESILKKIEKSKKRATNRNTIKYVSKIIDTVYITIPSPSTKSYTRLTDW